MAKRQTRRTISFNRAVYDAIRDKAAERGVTMAQFVEDAVRRATKLNLPPSVHLSPRDAEAMKNARQMGDPFYGSGQSSDPATRFVLRRELREQRMREREQQLRERLTRDAEKQEQRMRDMLERQTIGRLKRAWGLS